jgi:MFS family permease
MAFVVTRVLPAERPGGGETLREQLAGAGAYVRDRRVVAMMVAGFTSFVLIFGLVLTTLPLHLKTTFGAGPIMRGFVLGLPALGNVTTALLVGRLAPRYGTWALTMAGFAVMGVMFAGISAAPVLAIVALCVLGYGFGEGLAIVPMQGYAAALAPAEHRGKVVSLWVSSARTGQFLGPVLVGPLVDAHGPRLPFALGALVAGASVFVMLALRRRLTVPPVSPVAG